MAHVMIVGGTEETRLLLRGLLRLYRHSIIAEGPSFRALPSSVPPGEHPSVALVDIDLDDREAVSGVAQLKREHPGLRVLLLTPTRTQIMEARAKEAGIDAIVRRPFAVHELMDALDGSEPGHRV